MAAFRRTSHSIDDNVAADIAPDLLWDVILSSDLLSSAECSDDYRRICAVRVEAEIARDHARQRQAPGEGCYAVLVRKFLVAETSARDIARASARFIAIFRSEAERDPSLWIARTVALRRREAFERAHATRLGYPGRAHASTAFDAHGRESRDSPQSSPDSQPLNT